MKKLELIDLLKQYIPLNTEELEYRDRIINYLLENEIYLGKSNSKGHITGSAWIINYNKSKVLLTNHKKLNMWVQLGGHTEEHENIMNTALREGIEESGLKSLKPISDSIFDVDVHKIPARKDEAEHFHYDIRFIFEADDKEPLQVTRESKELKWIYLDEIYNYSKEESLYRMVRKTNDLK